ncbi:hypothetical protein [Streptomyces sp. NPDC001927]
MRAHPSPADPGRIDSLAEQLWAVGAFTVLRSVLLHSAAATADIRHLDPPAPTLPHPEPGRG